MIKSIFIALLMSLLVGCMNTNASFATRSELAQGKRYFEKGYYKSAMRELLPLACDGAFEAQYAIGYMYYYGLGVNQDTDVGHFWIKRSADKGYPPAIRGLRLIGEERAQAEREKQGLHKPHERMKENSRVVK